MLASRGTLCVHSASTSGPFHVSSVCPGTLSLQTGRSAPGPRWPNSSLTIRAGLVAAVALLCNCPRRLSRSGAHKARGFPAPPARSLARDRDSLPRQRYPRRRWLRWPAPQERAGYLTRVPGRDALPAPPLRPLWSLRGLGRQVGEQPVRRAAGRNWLASTLEKVPCVLCAVSALWPRPRWPPFV